ncbi:MAG: TIGR02452 family protein [Pelodictyon luteolum]|uniref:TIGR02452 family protein n=1 Tax=Pelodictyon luteolum TaxID=1100 RepID=A0A165LS80_PELLU|nr:TIGR02452 family protein [Pelodictyon luteolum]KZK74363.1 MAG: TIGR02452 family protein [Pelodictyon luteolum]
MSDTLPALRILDCLDSPEMATSCRQDLDIPRYKATELGRSAVEAANRGFYLDSNGRKVNWNNAVSTAQSLTQSIPPDAKLEISRGTLLSETRVQVCNNTTLHASIRLVQEGHRPLALNFANGVYPGGGFLSGARAQEEVLCRSSALYATLVDDPMYEYHRKRSRPDSSDWVIYSPDVPVFRTDSGTELDEPWSLSFLTSAAPYALSIGQPESGDLLQKRIHRILAVASAYGYEALVLGAWGCGAFANDPYRTALDFRHALEADFAGHFSDVVFAVADWSPERRFLGPFAAVFS